MRPNGLADTRTGVGKIESTNEGNPLPRHFALKEKLMKSFVMKWIVLTIQDSIRTHVRD